jgi:hypothetical protein
MYLGGLLSRLPPAAMHEVLHEVSRKAPMPPATMRAVVWRGDPDPGQMRIEVLRMPEPKANEVLIKVRACGVCHTDLHCIKGEVPFPQPAVFGHEICGEVVRYGPLAAEAKVPSRLRPYTPAGTTQHPLPAGTKVISPFIMPCGECAFCHKGEEDTCSTFFALNRLKGHLYDDSTRLFTAATGEEVACCTLTLALALALALGPTPTLTLTLTLTPGRHVLVRRPSGVLCGTAQRRLRAARGAAPA